MILTALGLTGAGLTLLLGFNWAPTVDADAWNSPEAYRILYWHVPFAWSSFLAYCVLFIGSVAWYARRSELGWRMICTGSDLALLFGLGVVISGPIWGSAEWGVPWDWGDLRLNTYGLLTAVSLFLVLARGSQPDGQGTIRLRSGACDRSGYHLVSGAPPRYSNHRQRGVGAGPRDSDSPDLGLRLILPVVRRPCHSQ